MDITEIMALKGGTFVKHVPSNTLMLKGQDGLTNVQLGALRKWSILPHTEYILVSVSIKENWEIKQ